MRPQKTPTEFETDSTDTFLGAEQAEVMSEISYNYEEPKPSEDASLSLEHVVSPNRDPNEQAIVTNKYEDAKDPSFLSAFDDGSWSSKKSVNFSSQSHTRFHRRDSEPADHSSYRDTSLVVKLDECENEIDVKRGPGLKSTRERFASLPTEVEGRVPLKSASQSELDADDGLTSESASTSLDNDLSDQGLKEEYVRDKPRPCSSGARLDHYDRIHNRSSPKSSTRVRSVKTLFRPVKSTLSIESTTQGRTLFDILSIPKGTDQSKPNLEQSKGLKEAEGIDYTWASKMEPLNPFGDHFVSDYPSDLDTNAQKIVPKKTLACIASLGRNLAACCTDFKEFQSTFRGISDVNIKSPPSIEKNKEGRRMSYFHDLEVNCSTSGPESVSIKSDYELFQNENELLKSDNMALKARVDSLEIMLKDQIETEDTNSGATNTHEAKKEEFKSNKSSLEACMADVLANKTELELKLEEATAKAAISTDDLKECQNAKKNLDDRLSQSREEISILRMENAKSVNLIASLTAEKDETMKDLAIAEGKVASANEAQKASNTALAAAHSAQISIQAMLDSTNQKHSETSSERDVAIQEIHKLQNLVSGKEREITDLESQASTLCDEISSLKGKVKSLNTKNKDLNRELVTLQEVNAEEIEQVRAELSRANILNDKRAGTIDGLKSKIVALEEVVKILSKQNEDHLHELITIRKRSEADVKSIAKAKTKATEELRAAARIKFAELKLEHNNVTDNLRSQLKEYESEIHQLSVEKALLEADVKRIDAAHSAEIDDLRRKLRLLEARPKLSRPNNSLRGALVGSSPASETLDKARAQTSFARINSFRSNHAKCSNVFHSREFFSVEGLWECNAYKNPKIEELDVSKSEIPLDMDAKTELIFKAFESKAGFLRRYALLDLLANDPSKAQCGGISLRDRLGEPMHGYLERCLQFDRADGLPSRQIANPNRYIGPIQVLSLLYECLNRTEDMEIKERILNDMRHEQSNYRAEMGLSETPVIDNDAGNGPRRIVFRTAGPVPKPPNLSEITIISRLCKPLKNSSRAPRESENSYTHGTSMQIEAWRQSLEKELIAKGKELYAKKMELFEMDENLRELERAYETSQVVRDFYSNSARRILLTICTIILEHNDLLDIRELRALLLCSEKMSRLLPLAAEFLPLALANAFEAVPGK